MLLLLQAMLGDIDKAMKTIHNFHQVWKQFGFLPEFYNIVKNEAHSGREGYPLRPGETSWSDQLVISDCANSVLRFLALKSFIFLVVY